MPLQGMRSTLQPGIYCEYSQLSARTMTVSFKTLTCFWSLACFHLPPIDRLSIDSTFMWSLGTADVSLLVPVRANGYAT